MSTGINDDFGASSDAHISLNLPNLPVDSDPELAETAAAKYLYREIRQDFEESIESKFIVATFVIEAISLNACFFLH